MLELREMTPQLEPRELPYYMSKMPFYSVDTLKDEYDVLFNQKLSVRGQIVIAIKKDKSHAIIGKAANRPNDKKPGMYIYGRLEFKSGLDIGDNIPSTLISRPTLQIDGVEIFKDFKREGYGYLLYFTLIRHGYAIVCDNTQYLGGQALWKKIAREANFNNYKVYVMDNGIFRRDKGQYVFYDGSNIQDSQLWSNKYERYHTLFVAIGN